MRVLAFAAVLGLFATGCAVPPERQQTPIETREVQTRDFDESDFKLVMKAMLNVLQDEGYVVKNAVVDLGLITAAKEIDLAPRRSGADDDAIFDVFGSPTVIFGGRGGVFVGGSPGGGRFRKTEVIDCTSNVSEVGQQSRVRVSFQRKVLDDRGGTVSSEPIRDPAFYQEFFSKVDKAIFLQKEQL